MGVPMTLMISRPDCAVMAAGATEAAPGASVGHLTTKARGEWAERRHTLLDCHPSNTEKLDAIETALFCVSLEETVPKNTLEACEHLLHGKSANRWFDKAISLIIFKDGTAGINGEHSCLDGTTIVNFIDTLLGGSATEHSRQSGAQSQGMPAFEAIEFALDADLQNDVRTAAASFAAYAANTAATVLSFEDFGGNRVKQWRISPDAFIQMAYQLAHKRANGLLGTTYESITTRQYRCGRTEAMRVVSPEVVRFVAVMDDPETDKATRRTAFRAAAENHAKRAKECQAGHAPEQHLWELQLLQKHHGETLGVTESLALYETPGWLKMRDDYLSTSAVPSTNVQYFGFGPTSTRCIGIAYAILPDRFNLHLVTLRTVGDGMALFVDNLVKVFREIQDLFA